jgi:hypothetical protein
LHCIRGGTFWSGVICETDCGAGTNATSPQEYNPDLPNVSCRPVEAHLRALKVDPERLSAIGSGDASLLFPKVPLRADNCRVEIA